MDKKQSQEKGKQKARPLTDAQSSALRESLGKKLKKARVETKLTQAEVAKKADVHVNYYARIERGEENPSYEKLHGILRALGLKKIEL